MTKLYCSKFARQGAKLILSARREEELKCVKSNIKIEAYIIVVLDLVQQDSFKRKLCKP